MMSEKRFTCVLGNDYHIINNNVDDMTYFLQDRNDVILVMNLLNKLVEENEQLKKENRMLKKDLNKLYNLLMDKGMSHNELQDVLW